MQQFLSPLVNKRTDEVCRSRPGIRITMNVLLTYVCLQYGGTLENRARFLLEIVDGIKARLPSNRFVIATKLNCADCTVPVLTNLTSQSTNPAHSHRRRNKLCRDVRRHKVARRCWG